MKSYSEITYRYLKVQKKRSILTVVGIVLSVALLTSIFTMMVSLRDKMIRDAIKNNGDYHARFVNITGDKVYKIGNNVEVKEYGVAESVGTALIYKATEQDRKTNPEKMPYNYLTISGYDDDAFKSRGISAIEGRLPKAANELVLDRSSLIGFENTPKIGDKIKLELGIRKDGSSGKIMPENSWSSNEIFEKTDEREFNIVGITNSRSMYGHGSTFYGATYMDSGFLKDKGNYNVYIKLKSTKNAYEKLENIAKGSGLSVTNNEGKGIAKYNIQTNQELLKLYAQSLSPTANEGALLTLMFIIALIIISTVAVIYNAFHISVLERVSQFGILRCTGASPNQIRNIVLKEAGILSLIGIPLGLFSGIFAMKSVISIIGGFKYNFFEDMQIVVSPQVFILGALLGIVTVYLSAFGPARQAGHVSALEAVRNTGSFKKENFKKVKKSRLAGVLFGAEGQLAYKNLRRNKKRFRITIFSMVISIVLYIVFGSFVDFIFNMNVIQDSKNPDFRVYKSSKKDEGIEESVYTELKSLPEVDKVFKQMNQNPILVMPKEIVNPKLNENNWGSKPYPIGDELGLLNNSLICYGDEGLKEVKKYLKEGSIDKDALNKENGVILIKTGNIRTGEFDKGMMIDVINSKVGDKIKLSLDYELLSKRQEKDIKYSEVKVMAIAEKGLFSYDYNPNGGVILITTEEVFKAITGIGNNSTLLLTLKQNTDKQSVINYLDNLKQKDYRYGYSDMVERAREERENWITISIFLYGFIGVITLIGCLNIINTISTNLILRTRELSMLKAVGMAKTAIEKMVCLEAIFYGAIAALYGGIVGTGLSYILFRFMMNVREFEFFLPIKHIITAMIGSILIALISGIIPLKKINKGSIIDHIRMEE